MPVIRALAVTVGAVAVVACGRQLTAREDIIGTYVLRGVDAADTLVVRPDGRYTRAFHLPSGASVIDSGSWAMQGAPDDHLIEFSDFTVSPGASFSPPRRAYWYTDAERTAFGEVRLWVDADLGQAYVRLTEH